MAEGGNESEGMYGTGGDSVYRLASDQSRESEGRMMMMWRYIFDILAPLDRNKQKTPQKNRKGKMESNNFPLGKCSSMMKAQKFLAS